MRRIGMRLLSRAALPAGALVEIGCGGGSFLVDLGRQWPDRPVVGLDLRWDALVYARQRQADSLIQAHVGHMPLADSSCALVVALDVFDQASVELAQALSFCRSLLRPGGYLLLRVSALAWLSSPHDAAFGTSHRFGASEIRQALQTADLSPVRLTYANGLLLPLTAANRLLQRLGLMDVDSAFWSDGPVSALFFACLAGEAALLGRYDLPIGSSIYCLAQRPTETPTETARARQVCPSSPQRRAVIDAAQEYRE